MSLSEIKKNLRSLADKKKAHVYQRFFKTGVGEYGEGDVFLGVTVPNIRKLVKQYSDITFENVEKFLTSKYHEERLFSLLVLVEKFQKCDKNASNNKGCKRKIFSLYIKNTKYVNNWDLVDLSAHKIVGAYLQDKNRDLLYKFAQSSNLWKKRISIISTFWYIKDMDFKDTLNISEILLCDEHDLIHKAVGWALREVGKKDFETEDKFLKIHYKNMPRTMLRYAIERFPEQLRQKYLKGEI